MCTGSSDNLGFLSRMSELELRLKQSEDERLVLEEKFNKLLSARKSEEEMHLHLLRENYSQLLRQDRMRCERNDMILQALANVESRATMLTAKTDRLRLLRKHYESFVSQHYPVLKRTVGRHRSVESLISDSNENSLQRSLSSSPRLATSISPSPFLRSPSITRRNSLVVSNAEILYPNTFKVPNKLYFTPHTSRRKLFEESPTSGNIPDNKPISSFHFHRNENVFNNNIPALMLNSTDQTELTPRYEIERNTSGSFLEIPLHQSYSEEPVVKSNNASEKSENETPFGRHNQPLRSRISENYERRSPTRNSISAFSPKPTPTKPVTKSSSFSVGSGFSRNFINNFIPEKRQTSLTRRSSLLSPTPVSSQFTSRFHSPVTNDSAYNERSSFRGRYSVSERSKSPLSERSKFPLSGREMLSTMIKPKSPLTVVDDIFKKYLINYDRTYLSDPISESKYGKYLYPSSNFDYPYNSDQRTPNSYLRKEPSYFFESKFDRTPYFDDDISISSRGSVSNSNLYRSKSFGSHDSLSSNDRRPLFQERNLSYFNDKKDWKEWNQYKNRYEYPPSFPSERPQTRSTLVDDAYYSSPREYIRGDVGKMTSYNLPDDLSRGYSYPSNTYGEIHEYNTNETDLENLIESKDSESGTLYERKKQNLTTTDTFRTPQTPMRTKKVSFSNEFLYDDKSDTEISSTEDRTASFNQDFDETARKTKTSDKKEPEQEEIKLSRETKHFCLDNFDSKLGVEKTNGWETNEEQFKYLNENSGIGIVNNTLESVKDLDSANQRKEPIYQGDSGKNTIHLKTTQNNSEIYPNESILKEKKSNGNYLLTNDDEKEDIKVDETGCISVENIEDTKIEKIDINDESSLGPNNNQYSNHAQDDLLKNLPTQKEYLPEGNKTQFAQENLTDNNNVNSVTDITVNSLAAQDTTPQQYDSTGTENLQRQKSEGDDLYKTSLAEHEVDFKPKLEIINDQAGSLDQRETYDNDASQDPKTYKSNDDLSEYPNDYTSDQYGQSQQQYDIMAQKEDDLSKEYIQKDTPEPRYDNAQDVYGPEGYQGSEVYSSDQYEQKPQDKGFKGSQQNIQDYTQPQYGDDGYVNQDQFNQQYKESDIHYSTENIPENYVPEQSYQGEYPTEYSQQQYDPNYQDPLQEPQNVPEQYETDYNTAYQDGTQYGYDQGEGSYNEKYEQQSQQYDQQQPPYEQYEQQPHDPSYDQYDQKHEPTYDQYEQRPADPPYDQYEQQPAEPTFDQYEQQPADPPYDQYEQQPAEPPFDQYEQQPAEPTFDQYEQQPAEPTFDQYEQQPAEPPYDQYQQPVETPYDQYVQRPAEPPYDQYEQEPAEPTFDQYEQQPAEPPYDQYQQPVEPPYDQYEQQSTEPPYDQYQQQLAEPPYDQYQGDPNEYGNYDYAYDQSAPIRENTYLGDEQQNYEQTQPYDYNESVQQQPYDDVTQQQQYSENLTYEGTETAYPDEHNVYTDEQPTDYDYSHNPQTDTQLSQDEQLYEPQAAPYPQGDSDASFPAPNLNQILESDPDSTATQGPTTHEDSSDFDFSAGKK